MTIAACYLSPEGVVFGADSTTTIGDHHFNFGQKIFELGDGGSGAIIGRAALRHAIACIHGLGTVSALTEHILAATGRDQEKLAAWAKKLRPADYARFAPDVFRFADGGDPIGRAIAAEALAELEAVVRRLREIGALRLSLLGGLAGPLQSLFPEFGAAFVTPTADAVDGAIMAARAAAGLSMLANGP